MKRPSPQAAREWSRALLYVGVVTALGTILYFVFTVFLGVGASFSHLNDDFEVVKGVASWVGLAMAAFGLAWLVRIYRRDPEAGPSPWRYHEWD